LKEARHGADIRGNLTSSRAKKIADCASTMDNDDILMLEYFSGHISANTQTKNLTHVIVECSISTKKVTLKRQKAHWLSLCESCGSHGIGWRGEVLKYHGWFIEKDLQLEHSIRCKHHRFNKLVQSRTQTTQTTLPKDRRCICM